MPVLSRLCLLFVAFVLLPACSSGGNYAPVNDLDKSSAKSRPSYVVSRGETLYSIAWSRNLSVKGLARANRIAPPYTIYPGQVLVLTDRADAVPQAARPRSGKPATSTATRPKSAPKTTAASGSTASQSSKAILDRNTYPFRWQWPAKGKVIRGYRASGAVHRGIDLKGKLGEPVYAANSGVVVYAGSGLKGYGNLLIVKHNEYYLSAYGHNSELLVGEGEKVKSGQQIAKIGDTGTNELKLHFEIRRDGKPIDPTSLLPKKR